MSFASELQAIRDAFVAAIETKGVPVPPGSTFADLPPLVLLIEGGTGPIVSDVTSLGDVVTFGGETVIVFGSFA